MTLLCVVNPCGGQSAEEFAGDVPLEATADFTVWHLLGLASGDVGLGAFAVPPPGLGDVVQGSVELSVAAPVEAVPVGLECPRFCGLEIKQAVR